MFLLQIEQLHIAKCKFSNHNHLRGVSRNSNASIALLAFRTISKVILSEAKDLVGFNILSAFPIFIYPDSSLRSE
jgi:hypothetical protein